MISANVGPTVQAMRQVLGEFDRHRQRMVENRGRRAWKWKEGVILFPEALCPTCNGVMRSNRIWEVDERAQRLIKAVTLRHKSLQRVNTFVHPHVNGGSSGPICIGDAKSATEALFFGLGMGSPYWVAGQTWYKEAFDHTCTDTTRRYSRDHLSESIKLAEKKAPPPPAPVVVARGTNAPLFNGQMAGNSESTGISVDDQPRGLRLDRL